MARGIFFLVALACVVAVISSFNVAAAAPVSFGAQSHLVPLLGHRENSVEAAIHELGSPQPDDADRILFVFRKSAIADAVESFVSKVRDGGLFEMRLFKIGKMRGFTATVPRHLLEMLRGRVDLFEYAEYDSLVFTSTIETQANATWGLDRVDQAQLPLDYSYSYSIHGGEGIDAYIVDTGINIDHVAFNGRAVHGHNAVRLEGPEDLNGHGTHVAGTIGSDTYGIAKKVNLINVKVMSGSGRGSTFSIISGIEYVAANGRPGRSVANMSLGTTSPVQTIDDAVAAAIEAGVVFVVAAGNSDNDACNNSPARAEGAITVMASDDSDNRAYFSSWGTCCEIFAPGVNITSTWYDSPTATNTISGTSMASPHVAGAVAMILGDSIAENRYLTPAEVTNILLENASVGVIGDAVNGSPDALLNVPYK